MFCSSCGKELNEHVMFCKYCGAPVNEEVKEEITISKRSGSEQLNTVFNRDVLINYLYNIRTLEFYYDKLARQKQNLVNRISQLGFRKLGEREGLSYTIGDIGLALICAGIGLVLGLIIGWLKNTWVGDFFEIEDFMGGLSIFLIAASVLLVIGSFVYLIVKNINYNEEYEAALSKDKSRVLAELKLRDDLSEKLCRIEEELKKTEEMRSEAYSLNIIPSKFRDIYGAYFLYDFISTSTASLDSAFLHYDLDAIQQQLEKIISQQEEIILELSRANAYNEALVSQNKQLLNSAIQTETNTALAAQYSKVAAINSSVTAGIQLSEFLGK